MTKEEALEVSRVTAFRLARHQGRTDADNQEFYDLDPLTYIIAGMGHFLGRNKDGDPTKIKTERDAIELCMDVARTLALSYYVKINGPASTPVARDLDRLAKHEVERTVELLRNREAVKHYSNLDPSEARAAHEMQVPFDAALTLGEIGLLKDDPGPTHTRRKLISDIAGGIRDG